MKVEMTSANDIETLEKQINKFIKDKSIIDIKYQAIYYHNFIKHTAMIMYSEG